MLLSLLLRSSRSVGGLIISSQKIHLFSRIVVFLPDRLEEYLNIFDYVLHRTRNPFYCPEGNLSLRGQDGSRGRHVSLRLSAWIYDRPFLCTSKGANTHPCVEMQRYGQKLMKRRENINKASSAGICCWTAVYIFTQACIIMVCLVCRSSQKLFRSPGVWKAFKHFIRISPLW